MALKFEWQNAEKTVAELEEILLGVEPPGAIFHEKSLEECLDSPNSPRTCAFQGSSKVVVWRKEITYS